VAPCGSAANTPAPPPLAATPPDTGTAVLVAYTSLKVPSPFTPSTRAG